MVRQLGRTLNYHFRYQDPEVAPEAARETGHRYIYAFFHEVMLFPAHYWPWPEMHILISDHRDGELITQVIKRLGFSVVRGSTTRGGTAGTREMTLRIDRGHLCVTPDGPRAAAVGPPGNRLPGQPDWVSDRRSRNGVQEPWRARSWDRFCVPRPFSPAACVVPRGRSSCRAAPTATRSKHAGSKSSGECSQAMLEAEAWVEEL